MATSTDTELTLLNEDLGSLFIGYTACCIIFGITIMQIYIYYKRYWRREVYTMRIFVTFLWILDIVQMAFTSHAGYFYLISHFGDATYLITHNVVWSVQALFVLIALSDYLVRCFYCSRLWTLSTSNIYVAVGVNVVSFISFVCGILLAATHRKIGPEADNVAWSIYLNTSTVVLSDTTIAVALLICLRRVDDSVAKTHSLVVKLIQYVVGTSMLTSLCAIAILVAFSIRPHTFIFMAFFMLLSKLYFNAMLVNLNARTAIRSDHSKSPRSRRHNHSRPCPACTCGARDNAREDNACRGGDGNGGGGGHGGRTGDAESQISTEPLSFSFTRTDEILGYSVNYNVPWYHDGRDAEMGVGDGAGNGEVEGHHVVNGNGGGMQEGYGMKEVGGIGGGSASGSGSGRTSEEQGRDVNRIQNGDGRGVQVGWGAGWGVRSGRWRS